MNINKLQLRTLRANASARLSDSQRYVFELESMLNEIKIRLEREKQKQSCAKAHYDEIIKMIDSIEDYDNV